MKKLILFFALFISCFVSAQKIQTKSEEIADQLDLKAIGALYGEAKSVEDFENKINDPDLAVSNLDMNEDGQVDYIRCVETVENGAHYIVLQAVLAKDIYQDVATIYTKKKDDKTITTQIIGNEFIYGTNYVIEPVYIYRPPIYNWFFAGPTVIVYHSPYYWDYYPIHWRYRSCIHYDVYCRHIIIFHTHHPLIHYNHHSCYIDVHIAIHHNDYAERHYSRSFSYRHPEHHNYRDVTTSRQRDIAPRLTQSTSTRTTSTRSSGYTQSSGTSTRSTSTSTRSSGYTQSSGTSTRSSSNSSYTRTGSNSYGGSSTRSSGYTQSSGSSSTRTINNSSGSSTRSSGYSGSSRSSGYTQSSGSSRSSSGYTPTRSSGGSTSTRSSGSYSGSGRR